MSAADAIEQAEAGERAAFTEIGALGARELDAVKVWVASGCEGPQPRPDADARRMLADRLSAAIAVREAAERAADGRDGAACRDAPPAVEIAATGRLCGAAVPS